MLHWLHRISSPLSSFHLDWFRDFYRAWGRATLLQDERRPRCISLFGPHPSRHLPLMFEQRSRRPVAQVEVVFKWHSQQSRRFVGRIVVFRRYQGVVSIGTKRPLTTMVKAPYLTSQAYARGANVSVLHD